MIGSGRSVRGGLVAVVGLSLSLLSAPDAEAAGLITPSVASGVVGDPVTFTGFLPPKQAHGVALRRKSGRKWIKVVGGRTDRTGHYALSTTMTATATYRVFANQKRTRAVTITVAASRPGVTPDAVGAYPSGVAFRGVNRAGAEYGDDWTGWTGQRYCEIPSGSQTSAELSYFKSRGFNLIRFPISWERLQPTLNGALQPTYLSETLAYIDAATSAGFHVVLDLHNYARYATGTRVSDCGIGEDGTDGGYTQRLLGDGFLTFGHLVDVWTKLANQVKNNPNVILNLMNEPHDLNMTSSAWYGGVQQVVNGIRGAGSSQLILVPNTRGSDVDHFFLDYTTTDHVPDSTAILQVTDSANNLAYDMHAYQNNPTSGTSYATLLSSVTSWARTHGRRLFLSEMGSVINAANGQAGVGGALAHMRDNSDVWIGWSPWDQDPYRISTDAHTADASPSEMSWYAPYLTANFLP